MATKRPNPVELLSANAGKIIKRKNQDLKSVAARCGFSEKTLYNILNGKHSATLGKIDDIARALGVHVYELQTGEKRQSDQQTSQIQSSRLVRRKAVYRVSSTDVPPPKLQASAAK
jgi:transcriptional regulator with XRE-family HTH domain